MVDFEPFGAQAVRRKCPIGDRLPARGDVPCWAPPESPDVVIRELRVLS